MNTLRKRLLSTLCMVAFGVCFVVAQTNTIKHTVDRGETLASIAKHYGVTEEKIIELNPESAQFIYVGMELFVPFTVKGKQESQSPNNIISHSDEKNIQNVSVGQYGNEKQEYLNEKENDRETPSSIYGVFFHSTFEDEKFKSGGILEFRGSILVKRNFGFDYSVGLGVAWKPQFTVSNCIVALGPCYGVNLAPICDFYVPAKLMCSIYFDSDDKAKTSWGAIINPMFMFGKKTCKVGVGAYCCMAKETAVGLTLGLAITM